MGRSLSEESFTFSKNEIKIKAAVNQLNTIPDGHSAYFYLKKL